MFAYREIYTIATPRQADYETRVLGLHARIAQEPSCRGAVLLRFLGNASRYQAFRFWDAKEAAQAWGRHPDMQAYLAARPPGNYLAPPQIDYYEEDARYRGAAGAAAFAVQEECLLAGGKQGEFESWNRDMAEQGAKTPGFIERRVFHFLGAPGRFITVALWASPAAYEAAAWGEGLGAFLADRPQMGHLAAPPHQEFWRVLDVRDR